MKRALLCSLLISAATIMSAQAVTYFYTTDPNQANGQQRFLAGTSFESPQVYIGYNGASTTGTNNPAVIANGPAYNFSFMSSVPQNGLTNISYQAANTMLTLNGATVANRFVFEISSIAYTSNFTPRSDVTVMAMNLSITIGSTTFSLPNITATGVNGYGAYVFDSVGPNEAINITGTITSTYNANLGAPSFGNISQSRGVSVAAVPEPSVWALGLTGLGLVGLLLRRRRESQ